MNALNTLIDIVSKIAVECMEKFKECIRGGISLENIFIDQNIIIGKALTESYLLEENVSVYPRIILSDNIHLKEAPKLRDFSKQLFLDLDGCICVNFLKYSKEISRIQEFLDLSLKEYANKKEVKVKYAWLNNYLIQFNEQQRKHLD